MLLTGTRLHWPIPALSRAVSKALSGETRLTALPPVTKNSFGIMLRLPAPAAVPRGLTRWGETEGKMRGKAFSLLGVY